MATRDTQRAKLYRAENRLRYGRDGYPSLDRPIGTGSIPEVEAYVKRVLSRKYIVRKYGTPSARRNGFMVPPYITDGRGTRIARGGASHLNIPRWARTEIVVLHELAHCIVMRKWGDDVEGTRHGWRYAGVFLDLMRNVMGTEVGDALKASFKQHRVRFTKPQAKRPMTEEQKAVLRERLTHAREAKAAKPKEEA